MLRVKTMIKESSVHGIGLFAAEPIAKGTVTWEFDPEFDTAFTEEQIARMPEPARLIFMKYAYWDKVISKYVLCSDDQRYINHATADFNIQSTPNQDSAAKDIAIGEELLCNYNDYDDTYFERSKETHLLS